MDRPLIERFALSEPLPIFALGLSGVSGQAAATFSGIGRSAVPRRGMSASATANQVKT